MCSTNYVKWLDAALEFGLWGKHSMVLSDGFNHMSSCVDERQWGASVGRWCSRPGSV